MRLFRKRYDPWPDIFAEAMRAIRELDDLAKAGEITTERHAHAIGRVRSTYESYTIYATLGRDRKKLGPEWAEMAENEMRAAVLSAL